MFEVLYLINKNNHFSDDGTVEHVFWCCGKNVRFY